MSFWYVATPYSKYPHGLDSACLLAQRATGLLIKNRIHAYSPIAHCHPISMATRIDPYDYDLWLPFNKPFIDTAKGLIVVRAESWETSYGVGEEIKEFERAKKPIRYMDCWEVPEGLS